MGCAEARKSIGWHVLEIDAQRQSRTENPRPTSQNTGSYDSVPKEAVTGGREKHSL